MSPNGGVTQSIAKAKVKPPHVSKSAREIHIFSSLASGSLYSVGQLCNDGCEAYFNNTSCTITKKGKLVLSGTRTANRQLWISDNAESPNALYYDAAKVNNFSQAAEPQATIKHTVRTSCTYNLKYDSTQTHSNTKHNCATERAHLKLSPTGRDSTPLPT